MIRCMPSNPPYSQPPSQSCLLLCMPVFVLCLCPASDAGERRCMPCKRHSTHARAPTDAQRQSPSGTDGPGDGAAAWMRACFVVDAFLPSCSLSLLWPFGNQPRDVKETKRVKTPSDQAMRCRMNRRIAVNPARLLKA